MQHLKGFGLENFRVFKDYTWFDFAPITLLIGPNSSGKSSLLKALLLLKDNFEKDIIPAQWKDLMDGKNLKFDGKYHELSDGKNILNSKNGTKIFRLGLPIKFEAFSDELIFDFTFEVLSKVGDSFKNRLFQ